MLWERGDEMSWIFIPAKSTMALINSKRLREHLSAQIADADTPTSRPTTLGEGSCLTLQGLSRSSALVGAWPAGERGDLVLHQHPLLAIWHGRDDSRIANLPEEELPSVIERLCLLASRLWTNTSLPEYWSARKVSDHRTVFLSSRLIDIRVAYALETVDGVQQVIVGTTFFAYHNKKKINVPSLAPGDISDLPARIAAPPEEREAGSLPDAMGENYRSEDADVRINRGRGEDRHLFSMSRSDWMENGSPLTTQQRRIINDKKCPLRIHGPGGSGKTLVLILKALSTLHAAAAQGNTCKVLMILHNNEVRNNIRAAIEAIDESDLLASDENDDQYLDVETLHSWCMKKLKIDAGEDYALHSDVVASKRRQDEILGHVLDHAIQHRLPNMGSLLSNDLTAHLLGPRDKLVEKMRHEIAIRIKGRGMRNEQKMYVESPLRSFVGRNENRSDRYFLFKIAEEYEKELQKAGRLDTDDVVLSMQSRLAAPLWNRQRKTLGYDFVFVDETHVFNENERRVLPYLTRGTEENLPIIMVFDEAQSIGGRRGELEEIGIHKSEQRRLSYVHRSSPQIYRLARDLIERTSLVFSEFSGDEAMSRMSERDLKKCKPPILVFSDGNESAATIAAEMAIELREKNYRRIGIISFDSFLLESIEQRIVERKGDGQILRERGDSRAGNPYPGIFIMTPENCGGLEFDGVILVGVDDGQVPPSLHNISPEGHLSVREEASKELYTALTRARYHVAFVCDRTNGASEFVTPWIDSGLLEQKPATRIGSAQR
jgi:superfamily I DNA/RNA helicase